MATDSQWKIIQQKLHLSIQDTKDLLQYSVEKLVSWGVSTSLQDKVKRVRDTHHSRYILRPLCDIYLAAMIEGYTVGGGSASNIAKLNIIRDKARHSDFRGILLSEFITLTITLQSSGGTIYITTDTTQHTIDTTTLYTIDTTSTLI